MHFQCISNAFQMHFQCISNARPMHFQYFPKLLRPKIWNMFCMQIHPFSWRLYIHVNVANHTLLPHFRAERNPTRRAGLGTRDGVLQCVTFVLVCIYDLLGKHDSKMWHTFLFQYYSYTSSYESHIGCINDMIIPMEYTLEEGRVWSDERCMLIWSKIFS